MTKPIILLAFTAAGALAQPASSDEVNRQLAELRALVLKLQARVDELESRGAPRAPVAAPIVSAPPAAVNAAPVDPLRGTTVNFDVDGYYGYNFNHPIGRVNRLRAYDVTSNNFSLNQAGVVLENAADPLKGKRWGARLDIQFGQATQTLQGNIANEPRPA